MKRLIAILVLCLPVLAWAQPVTATFNLEWTPNAESDMKEYRVYQALGAAGEFQLVATVQHPITSVAIQSAAAGLHRFHVRAVNAANLQSDPSNEVSATPPAPPGVVTLRLKGLIVEQTTTIAVP